MILRSVELKFVAAAAVCGVALAQPASEGVPAELEQRLLEQIGELRSQRGVHAEELVEPFRELGLLYQEAGDHAPAVVALREARQVLRANRGLFSATVDEALLLRLQAASEKALGNGQAAWDLQYDLINIARQHLDDIRMLPVFTELIDDRAELRAEFSTTAFKELPPGLFVPCTEEASPSYGGKGGSPAPVSDARFCTFGTWRAVVTRLDAAVLRHYADAIAVLIRSRDYANPELRELERETHGLVSFIEGFPNCRVGTIDEFLASELVGSCMDTARGSAIGGWASLMRLVFYEVRSGAPAADRARAYAELGDWYLQAEHLSSRPKYSRNDEVALKFYEEGLTALRQDADGHESMAEVFAPELPVMLPAHTPNPLASVQSPRFIDVAFAITKYGEAAEVEILDSSQNATWAEQRSLVRLVKYSSYRPRAVDGELADSAPVVVRYYLPEKPLLPP